MPGTDADRQQGGGRRLGPAAMGAAVRIVVGLGGVEKLDEDDVESGALSLSLRQIAHALDDDRPVLELTKPAVSVRGGVVRGFQRQPGHGMPNPSASRARASCPSHQSARHR